MKNNIKRYREDINITQEELSRKLDISLSQCRNIEKNRSICSVEVALKIAEILNKKVEDIFILEE